MSPYVFERFLPGDFSLGLVTLFTALNTTYNLMTPKFPLQPGRLPWIHAGRLECTCDPSAYIHAYLQASDVACPRSNSWSPIPTVYLHKTTFLVYISVKDSILPKTLESPLDLFPILLAPPHVSSNSKSARWACRNSQNLKPSPPPPSQSEPRPFSSRWEQPTPPWNPCVLFAPLQNTAARDILIKCKSGLGTPSQTTWVKVKIFKLSTRQHSSPVILSPPPFYLQPLWASPTTWYISSAWGASAPGFPLPEMVLPHYFQGSFPHPPPKATFLGGPP